MVYAHASRPAGDGDRQVSRASRPDEARVTDRVQLWLREPVPDEIRQTQRAVCARLRRLARRGAVPTPEIRTWASPVFASTERSDDDVRDAIETFEEWSDGEIFDSLSGFERERTSTIDGDEIALVRLPMQCLSLYREGELRFVAPCVIDERVVTVRDVLRTLERDADAGRVRTDDLCGTLRGGSA